MEEPQAPLETTAQTDRPAQGDPDDGWYQDPRPRFNYRLEERIRRGQIILVAPGEPLPEGYALIDIPAGDEESEETETTSRVPENDSSPTPDLPQTG